LSVASHITEHFSGVAAPVPGSIWLTDVALGGTSS